MHVRYYRHRLGVSFDPRSHEVLFFAKFADWSYEQEVRVVLPLADCRQESLAGKVLYLSEVARTCIARLLLGWNMDRATVAAVREYASEFNPAVEVLHARYQAGTVVIGTT
jgi:hypothetical protein